MAVERTTSATTSASTRQRARRRKLPLSFVLAGAAIAGAILYLVLANTGASAEYYLTIGELRACKTCGAQAVRVAGQVAAKSVARDAKGQVARFTITDQGQSLPVAYGGIVPDVFRPGITVVVEGRVAADGVFHAQTLLAKCPSKFQSATPGASSNAGG